MLMKTKGKFLYPTMLLKNKVVSVQGCYARIRGAIICMVESGYITGAIAKSAPTGAFHFVIVLVLLGLAAPVSGGAAVDKHSGIQVKGVITAVDSTHLSVLGDDRAPMSFRTTQDYTRQVSVGLEVTLWYIVKDGAGQVEAVETAPETFLVPAGQIRERIRKIIILPSSEVPGAEGLFDAMRSYLEAQFGWYVAPAFLAEEIRERRLNAGAVRAGSKPASSTLDAIDPETGNFDISRYTQGRATDSSQSKPASQAKPEAEKPRQDQQRSDFGTGFRPGSTLDAIDPNTGQFDITRYLQSRPPTQAGAPDQTPKRSSQGQSLIPALASEARVDAVLEANVVAAQAKLDRLVARWDGVEEPIAGKGSQTVAKLSLVAPRGVAPAATVVLKLWDCQGRLLWTDRAGFAVLVVREGMAGKLRERAMSEVLANRTNVHKWLSNVFAPFAGSSSVRTARK